jgi:hypothetical protein
VYSRLVMLHCPLAFCLVAGGLLSRFGSSSSSGGVLSCAEVDLDDCAYDEDAATYSYPCRCGEEYVIDEAVLSDTGMDLFSCAQCSLVIRIMFEWQPNEAAQSTTTTGSSISAPLPKPTSSSASSSVEPDEMG